jgi:hypothetical protein
MLIYVMAGVAAGGCTSGFAFPGGATQLAGVAGTVIFAAAGGSALFYLARSWKQSRAFAVLPFLATMILAVLPLLVARPLAKWWFNIFRLQSYEAAASWVNAQTLRVNDPVDDPEWTPPFIDLPPQYARLARVTEAHRHRDGSSVVVFVYSSAFPVKHFGYMYSSSGAWDHHLDPRWRGVSIAPNWFAVLD